MAYNEQQDTYKVQNSEWWKSYNNKNINIFIDEVLVNNADINVASANLLVALSRYKLIDFDFYPSLSGNVGANISHNISTDMQSKGFASGLNIRYELDIYGKINDSIKAAQFSAKATEYDRESLKLTVINSSIDNIFDLAYFNDVERLLKEYLANLEQIRDILMLKYELGKGEELDVLNIEQNILQAQQNLLSNKHNQELSMKNLKDLLGNKDKFIYIDTLHTLSLNEFNAPELDFDIPLSTFLNRPDVRSSAYSLMSAFKNIDIASKSMLPSISLGGSLSGNSSNISEGFKLSILGGSLELSLPFLDYGRIRQNINIAQYSYEALRISYEHALQSAINEFWLCYRDYQNYNDILNNAKIYNKKQEQITTLYAQKYQWGKIELKDYLDSKNDFINSAQELLKAQLNIFKTINLYYKITTTQSV